MPAMRHMYRVYLKNRNARNFILYKQLCNESIRLTRLAKRQFFMLSAKSGSRLSGKMLKTVLVLVN